MKHPEVSVVLGSYNRVKFLPLTIQSVRQELQTFSHENHEIIVVDGGSDDGSLEWLLQQKDIITIVQHNRGNWLGGKIKRRSWGYFMNLAFKCAHGKYVCMISDDCLVVPGAITNGYELAEKELVGGRNIGGVAFYFRDWSKEKHYHVGCTLGEKMYVNHGLYLKKALEDVGYIDEESFFFYNGDGDLCLKMWHKGYEIIDSPDSFVEHYPHANLGVRKTNYKKFKQDLNTYLAKWDGIYYDRKKNNLGKTIDKNFYDDTQTWKLFTFLHEKIIKENPKVLLGKPFYKKISDNLKWKYKAVVRKLFAKIR